MIQKYDVVIIRGDETKTKWIVMRIFKNGECHLVRELVERVEHNYCLERSLIVIPK